MGYPVRFWTDERNAELRAHAAAGGTDHTFAALYPGLMPGAVRCQRARIKAPLTAPGKGRPWTPDEDAVILRMATDGETLSRMSAAMPGRSGASIAKHLAKLKAQAALLSTSGPVCALAREAAEAEVIEPPAPPVWVERLPREPVRVAMPVRPRRRVAPLFEVAPAVVRTPVRPKAGRDNFPGSVLTGVLIHPAHRRA